MGTMEETCNGSPAADSAPPLIAFGGKTKWMEREKMKTLSLEDFFIGPGKTALSPGGMLTEVEVPELLEGCGSAFLKMSRVSADLAKVSVAVAVVREGEVCSDCKIVFGAVGKTPLRTREAEAILIGKKVREDILDKAAERASEEIEPIDDIRSTAWYRRQVSKVLARDAILLAWKRTKETKK
jgi:carbon-monoxide dehydrogenase medium subunit